VDKSFDLVVLVIEKQGVKDRVLESVRLRLPVWNVQKAKMILTLISDWCRQAKKDLGAERIRIPMPKEPRR